MEKYEFAAAHERDGTLYKAGDPADKLSAADIAHLKKLGVLRLVQQQPAAKAPVVKAPKNDKVNTDDGNNQ